MKVERNGYLVVMEHPDDPVYIYDRMQPDEPLVCVAANADCADEWLQDHRVRAVEDVAPCNRER